MIEAPPARAMNMQDQSPLRHIPAEIRLIIFEYLLPPAPTKNNPHPNIWISTGKHGARVSGDQAKNLHPVILLTCKLFYKEAVAVLYKKTFTFGLPASIRVFNKRPITAEQPDTFEIFEKAFLTKLTRRNPLRQAKRTPAEGSEARWQSRREGERQEKQVQEAWLAHQEEVCKKQLRLIQEQSTQSLLTNRIVSLRLVFLNLDFSQLSSIPRDFRRHFEKTAESWAHGPLGLFQDTYTVCEQPRELFTPAVSEASNIFPNLIHLELGFPRFTSSHLDLGHVGPGTMIANREPSDFPLVLLEGIKSSGWKLEKLTMKGLDGFKNHVLVKEEIEKALLKNPPPKEHTLLGY